MLDEKDLQAIQKMIDTSMDEKLAHQKQELLNEMAHQKQELLDEMARQKEEILDESTHRMQVLLDAEVRPQFNLLAEGQKLILEKLADLERVRTLEPRVDVLETAVKQHSREIAALKKAN